MNRAFVSGARFILIVTGIGLCFTLLLGRLVQLHVIKGPQYERIVERNRERFVVLHARRGAIVDSRGILLATTNSAYELGVDPQSVRPEDEAKIPELAKLINAPEAQIREAFRRRLRAVQGPEGEELVNVQWQRLAESIDEDAYRAVQALGIRGVYGTRKFERVYPSGSLGAHILGFVNKEGVAASGVERFANFYLSGQDGWRQMERDGRRRELAQFRIRDVEPRSGLNVQLSLDSVIQHMVEEELAAIQEKFAPEGATIIVSDVQTGRILALGSSPTFDPNRFWDFPIAVLRNRAITDVYEPGSTFKIVPTAGALDEGVVTVSTTFDCSVATAEYNGRVVRLPKDDHPMAVLTVAEILEKSSNRGAAHLGIALGANRLYDTARSFGFGQRTGFALDVESAGILHAVNRWDGLTISRLPMGHAISATPLQVHYATSVIANGGVLMKPTIVERVFDENGETILTFEPESRQRVISQKVAAQINTMLQGVVSDSGTARRAMIKGYSVAGKTGTSQKIIDGRYSNRHHIGSFSGYFPANRPRLVITVVVDNPKVRGYGGVVAAPSFANLANQCIRYLGIPPDEVQEAEERAMAVSAQPSSFNGQPLLFNEQPLVSTPPPFATHSSPRR